MIPNLFFILGCQRTGTTLLRLILEGHSKIACIDETRAYSIISSHDLLQNEMVSYKNKKWIGFKTPRITEQMLEPFLADIGINLRTQNFFKRKPSIFLIRNVFDTVSSMMTLNQEGISWLDRWVESTIDFWKKTNPYFQKHFSEDLTYLKEKKCDKKVAAALYWKVKTSAYFNYLNNGVPIIKIKYEDLVTKTKSSIKTVLNFLDLKWESSMIFPEKFPHVETDEFGFTVGNTNTRLPITNSSIGNYTKFLSSEDKLNIMYLSKDLMEKLEYKL